jgi:hypothetical protein
MRFRASPETDNQTHHTIAGWHGEAVVTHIPPSRMHVNTRHHESSAQGARFLAVV